MNKHRIGALFAALALTLMFAGTAFASGSVDWTGNGITDGHFNTEQCDEANPAGTMLWVFSPGGNDSVTAAELTVNGTNYGAMNQDNGQWKLQIPLIDAGDVDSASVSYTGSLGNGNPVVTISHFCGETETTTTTTEETTSSTTTEETTSSTTTEETTSSTTTDETTSSTTDETTSTTSNETTPEGSVEELTPPHTDTIGQPTSSSTVSTSLLLVLAGMLSAALVVIPAAARKRR